MDKDTLTTILAVIFFLLCTTGFFGVHYYQDIVASFEVDNEIADEVAEQAKQDTMLAGAAVTEPEGNAGLLLIQVMIALSLLAVYGFVRFNRSADYSDEQLKKYFDIGVKRGYTVEQLRDELKSQGIKEEQINSVMGKL